MTAVDQITVYAQSGNAGRFGWIHSSFQQDAETDHWLWSLDSWLRIGRGLGCGYLNFGEKAVFIVWHGDTPSSRGWEYSIVFVGESSLLTPRFALELPDLDRRTMYAGDGQRWTSRPEHGPGRDARESLARSPDALSLLVPVLAHTCEGERSVTMPWTEPGLPEAAMWGLTSILEMIGDTRPVSFLTNTAVAITDHELPGTLITFRPGAPVVQPVPRYDSLAGRLASRFAADPDTLRQKLAENAALQWASDATRIARLLDAWPGIEADYADTRDAQTMTEQSHTGQPVKDAVRCPVCLHEIPDWDSLEYFKWDARRQEYVQSPAPADLNDIQLARHRRSAYRRCPRPEVDAGTAHYLPVSYGQFGNPVMLGFVGLTDSGKTHLMAAMVGAIENGGLQEYGVMSRPLDHAGHLRFLREHVEPLLNDGRQLEGTDEDVRMFADAFLMSFDGGQERPVIFFDVAGGDLAKEDESKEFLWIANGLFFVIDPEFISSQRAGDKTFANVLSVIESYRGKQVSAAIVLSKADKVRFEEPITRWLRTETNKLDPDDVLRESTDVYAYLHAKDAGALTRPYRVCDKTTLHIASPTGGPSEGERGNRTFPRGVTSRRVLRPLVAMLAMTGLLTGPEAERVGI